MTDFMRTYPLEDIRVRSGDGRTVEAYASAFAPVEYEIHDAEGHYREAVAPTSFDKTLAERGNSFGVFYNHGLTIMGTPSDRHSMPIGVPIEMRADSRGLLTVTRYNKTPLADEVLENIREGSIVGQSFSGRFLQSDKKPPRGGFRADSSGGLPLVTRTEIRLREYGPTPFPANSEAAVVGVRALMSRLAGLDDGERTELARLIALATPLDGIQDEPVQRTDTPEGAVTEEPPTGTPVGSPPTIRHLRRMAREKGVL